MASQLSKNTDCLTRETAAAYLGVSPGTLARWASEGEGPHYYKVGRATKYLPHDLDAFIETRRRPA
jgi:excisionase family DNA binding protein